VTYAGGARSIEDLTAVSRVSNGKVDLTIGSALDIFGGTGVRYADAVAFNRAHATSNPH
jgi:phosphoribosylformimino-5-aminoimidazole carboxamide ribotide isomerase